MELEIAITQINNHAEALLKSSFMESEKSKKRVKTMLSLINDYYEEHNRELLQKAYVIVVELQSLKKLASSKDLSAVEFYIISLLQQTHPISNVVL
ncbi:hypothetical protein [Methanococcus maripaludis]|uniref:tRNA A37 methylthiotransferase MiaB n=1 Tax=Methanococcus maripaludis TaxID=39152 RepID=A0A7J9PLL1_METMI|nr:hypothetical protein [Methanococcus maripaludis]MBA2863981.1 tRNA A37 methylthiotransferase MiaB [Methanococcus maripaludis]